MDRRFFHRLGASQLDRTICATAGGEALVSLYGRKYGTDPEAFAQAKYIIAWGSNIHGNNIHLWPFIEEARRAGAKLVVLDPYRTRTAACADWYLPINPGTDLLLALSMMHVIVAEQLTDDDYIARATLGYADLLPLINDPKHAPEATAATIGISAEDIRTLAREYATAKPAVIRVNYGVQRTDQGGSAIRAVAMLPLLTGAFRHHGGGLQLSTSGAFGLNRAALERPDLMQTSLGRPARTVNMSLLGSALTKLDDPPVHALYVYNSNPAAIAPDQSTVLRGLSRPDLFTVVHDQFLTDSCDYADIVLPACTWFEYKDLQTAYGHYYLQLSSPAIAPLGESRDNVTVFRDLARHMGFTEPCFSDTHDDLIDQALATDDPFVAGVTREQLERDHRVRLSQPKPSVILSDKPADLPDSLTVRQSNRGPIEESKDPGFNSGTSRVRDSATFAPFSDGTFPTASGRALIHNPALMHLGLDPVLEPFRPRESRTTSKSDYPLEMLTRKADNYLNSTFCNLPSHRPLEQNALLELHPADAAPRKIATGDRVRVFNDRGSLELTALVAPTPPSAHTTPSVQPGTVASRLNWNKLSPDGKGLNQLTPERLTDIGRGPTFYACLVQVEKLS